MDTSALRFPQDSREWHTNHLNGILNGILTVKAGGGITNLLKEFGARPEQC